MKNPLVTIIVITYNSSKFVLDTLNSIKTQTYKHLELIISDDCSSDDTREICYNFIGANSDIPFIRDAKVIKTEKNSGITPNYNNGLGFATGQWIKYIAGDDILVENSIERYVEYASNNDEKLYVSNVYIRRESQITYGTSNSKFFKGNVKDQFKSFILGNYSLLFGPSIFLEKDTLLSLGGFSEKYPMVEDIPLYLKYLKNGYRIYLIPERLVFYRVHQDSVSHCDPKYLESLISCYEEEIPSYLLRNRMYLYIYHNKLNNIMQKYILKNNWLHKLKVGYLLKLIDPVAWKKYIVKKRNMNKIEFLYGT